MSKFTYETVDGSKDGFVPNVGAIVDGKIESDTPIYNANLRIVSGNDGSPTPAPVSGTASQQNPDQPVSAGNAESSNPGESQ